MKNFEIQIPETDIKDASLLVRWKVNPELLKLLLLTKDEYYVVLCIFNTDHLYKKAEIRKIIPLKDSATYINFRYPGNNVIYAFITKKSEARAYMCMRSNYGIHYGPEWEREIVSYYPCHTGREFEIRNYGCEHSFSVNDIKTHTNMDTSDMELNYEHFNFKDTVEVDLPKDVFSKEPPDWEKEWVNYCFKYKPLDQCEYRKRRLVAYTVQPLLIVVNVMLRLIVMLISTLLGVIKLQYKDIFKPLSVPTSVFVDNFFSNAKVPLFNKHFKSLLLLTPISMFIFFVALSRPAGIWGGGYLYFAVPLACIVSLMVTIELALLLKRAVKAFINIAEDNAKWYVENKRNKVVAKKPEPVAIKPITIPENYKYVSEISESKFTSIDDIPNKTIRLRYEDLKSKICKPFAG